MESIRDFPKVEREFFEDEKGYIRYHEYCLECKKSCKQSFKVLSIISPTKEKAHTPDQYLNQIKKLKKDIKTIGKEIGINSKTVQSMLYERQDMSKELYDKLEKLLFSK